MYQYIKTIKKMISFDGVARENIKEHNLNWPQIHELPRRILIIR